MKKSNIGTEKEDNAVLEGAVRIHSDVSVSAVSSIAQHGRLEVKGHEELHNRQRDNAGASFQRRPVPNLPGTPRLMKAPMAALYLGVSVTKLKRLPIIPRRDGGNILYDVIDLNAYADTLPYEDEQEVNTCDKLFA